LLCDGNTSANIDTSDITDVPISDTRLFRTVYTCMKNDIPLDNVNTLLDLQRENGLSMPYQNLSWTTITEIAKIISFTLHQGVVDEIKSSVYFAILLDESTDIRVSKRLSLCVRYVKGGNAVSNFLTNLKIPDGRAHTIVEATMHFLESAGVDMTKCVSLATDRASADLFTPSMPCQ